jgi:hypothetical protein
MSTTPETDLNLDLHFLPAWAKSPADQNQYANYVGRPERSDDRRERKGPPRGFDRPRDRGPRRQGGDRPQGGGARPPQARGEGGLGAQRPRQQPGRGREGRGFPDRRQAPPPQPLVEVNCSFIPDDRGVESLARQIKMTGRAYPLFEIAQLILQKPERYSVTLAIKKNAEGQPLQPLFQCALDETVWLSEEEAVRHVLDRHFATFYQAEKTQTEPPKGTYTFVAQCGMSGQILGPPNYHDYQNQLRKLHAERFSRMPFDAFKARVRIVKDEAVVKKWIEEQSVKTEYIGLNIPEAVKLPSKEEVERHFRQVHVPNIIKQVEAAHLSGNASRGIRAPALSRLIRQTWDDQKRFPLQLATVLSQKFATQGLQFFKVNKSVTHVAVARPHYLDLDASPVSDGIRKIVQFINEHPKSTRRTLVDALAPGNPPATPAPDAPAPEPSPEYNALIGDLHWLVHQGHVIEFATGILETAKKPVTKPPRPAPAAPAAATPEPEASAATAPDLQNEAPPPSPAAEPSTESATPPAETASNGSTVTDSSHAPATEQISDSTGSA